MSCPFFKGVNWGFRLTSVNGYFSSEAAREEARKIAGLGIQWVCLNCIVMQDTFASVRQYRDFSRTPGDDELCDIIGYLHQLGIQVMLRPMIECHDGMQRVHINLPECSIYPNTVDYRKLWFESYAELTRHYCRIATRCGCEAYGMDSELNQLVPYTEYWMPVIETARKHFSGHLTSSFVGCHQYAGLVAAEPNHWFYALDSVGSSMYSPPHGRTRDAREMAKMLSYAVEENRAFANAYKGGNYYFGECGCCSVKDGAQLPWSPKGKTIYDGEEQANYMSAVIQAFSAEPWWHGMFWWNWDEGVSDSRLHFSIDGKPAAQIMKTWCAGNGDGN